MSHQMEGPTTGERGGPGIQQATGDGHKHSRTTDPRNVARRLPLALVIAAVVLTTTSTCGPTPAAAEPHPVSAPLATVTAVPVAPATYAPSKSKAWNQGVQAGLDYWTGRGGSTPPVTIVRGSNGCGPSAAGCSQRYSDGTCHLYIAKAQRGDRWATLAIALHEVGHCVGLGHIAGDLVMSP